MNTCKHFGMLPMALISVWITGCASFAHHGLPETGKLQPPADLSRAVKASYRFTSGSDTAEGVRMDYSPEKKSLEQEFVDQLRESGCFSSLRAGEGEEVHIDAEMLKNGAGLYAECVSLLQVTFGIVPCWGTVTYTLKATIVAAGGKQADYVLKDAITTVVWFPMMVAAPFAYPDKIYPNTLKNMYRNLVLKMQQDGLLPPAINQHQKSH